MKTDARGLAVSGASDEALEVINHFTARLLRLENGVEQILPAAERWPEVPMIRLCAGAFFLFGQTSDSVRQGISHLVAAPLDAANERERELHRALVLWSRNEYLAAVTVLEELTGKWPRDLLAAKFAEFLYYVMGQQHHGARFRAHMERLEPANPDDPDLLGMAAFAAELCGDFSDAERRAHRAIEIVPANAWAEHALSHVLIRQGRVEEGRARLETFLPTLANCQRLIHSHDAWHLALLHLEELDRTSMMEVYRGHIWGFAPDLVGEQVDAISLLWRAELAGFEMEWEDIAAHAAPRAGEAFMPFLSAHHAYAFARAGCEAELAECLATVRRRAEANDNESRRVWAGAGSAVVEACALFGQGDRAGAAAVFEPVIPDLTTVGGSDAQDDLFRQTFLRGLQAAGRHVEARGYFERISGDKIRTPLDAVLNS